MCVSVGFVMCGFLYVWVFYCDGVCMCGCVCVGLGMCGCVYVWVCVCFVICGCVYVWVF